MNNQTTITKPTSLKEKQETKIPKVKLTRSYAILEEETFEDYKKREAVLNNPTKANPVDRVFTFVERRDGKVIRQFSGVINSFWRQNESLTYPELHAPEGTVNYNLVVFARNEDNYIMDQIWMKYNDGIEDRIEGGDGMVHPHNGTFYHITPHLHKTDIG